MGEGKGRMYGKLELAWQHKLPAPEVAGGKVAWVSRDLGPNSATLEYGRMIQLDWFELRMELYQKFCCDIYIL